MAFRISEYEEFLREHEYTEKHYVESSDSDSGYELVFHYFDTLVERLTKDYNNESRTQDFWYTEQELLDEAMERLQKKEVYGN